MSTRKYQLEEMVTPLLLQNLRRIQIQTDQLMFCINCIRNYGYPEYAMTEETLANHGRSLYNMMVELSKKTETYTDTI